MKKNLIKGMVALCVCAMFASCSKDPGYEVASNPAELAKIQYKNAFEKKYGAIDPNQTWDFSVPYQSLNFARTRFEMNTTDRTPQAQYTTPSGIVMKEYTLGVGQGAISGHKSQIKKKLANGQYETKQWDTNVNVFSIFACFVTSPTDDKDHNYYMKIGVHSVGLDGTEYNTCILNNGSGYKSIKGYDMNTAFAGAYYEVDVTGMKAKSSDYYWYCVATASTTDDPEAKNDILDDAAKLVDYREVQYGGVTYWCFDSNHDNTYTGLICQVSPTLYGKRYMIEDLGSIGDFDFNDIVVDVYETFDGQKAVVRALGGTLGFTLHIGSTTWTKSPTFVNTEMRNTKGNIDYDAELYVIENITDWDPINNNISVEIEGKDGDPNSHGVLTITFPKAGDAPMIIAVDPVKRWMNETISVPGDWFTEDPLNND